MNRSLTVIAVAIVVLAGGGAWYVQSKLPVRQGQVALAALQGPVTVRYDERGVPHIRAGNQADMYRALGYVQAQDRLFQMEIMRRLATIGIGPGMTADDASAVAARLTAELARLF